MGHSRHASDRSICNLEMPSWATADNVRNVASRSLTYKVRMIFFSVLEKSIPAMEFDGISSRKEG